MNNLKKLVRIYNSPLSCKIKRLASPLSTHLGLTSFCFTNIRSDDTFVQLSTHPDQTQIYYDEGLFLANPFLRHPSTYESGSYFLEDIQDNSYQTMQNRCVKQGLTLYYRIIEKTPFSAYQFLFGSTLHDYQFYKVYSRYHSLLNSFTKYFIEQMLPYEKAMENYSISLKDLMGDRYREKSPVLKSNEKKIVNKFYSELGFNLPTLTMREEEFAKLYLKGLSCSEIAKILHLSVRTVENRAARLKDKFLCSKKSTLLQRLTEWQNIT
jgi:DNA-binding CsgD family transcriptional regulator